MLRKAKKLAKAVQISFQFDDFFDSIPILRIFEIFTKTSHPKLVGTPCMSINCLGLVLQKGFVRLSVNDERILVRKTTDCIYLNCSLVRLLFGTKAETFLADQLEHPVFTVDLAVVKSNFEHYKQLYI